MSGGNDEHDNLPHVLFPGGVSGTCDVTRIVTTKVCLSL
jgi:hypothetical protein